VTVLPFGYLLVTYRLSPTFLIAHVNRFAPVKEVSGPGILHTAIVQYPYVCSLHAPRGNTAPAGAGTVPAILFVYNILTGESESVELSLDARSDMGAGTGVLDTVVLFVAGQLLYVINGPSVTSLAASLPIQRNSIVKVTLKDSRSQRTIYNLDRDQSCVIPGSEGHLLLVARDTAQVWQCPSQSACMLLTQVSASGDDGNPSTFLIVKGFKDTVVGVTRSSTRTWLTTHQRYTEPTPAAVIPHSDTRITTSIFLDSSFLVTGDNLGLVTLYERKSGKVIYAINEVAPPSAKEANNSLLKMEVASRVTVIERLGRFFFVGFASCSFAIYDMNERESASPVRNYQHPHAGGVRSALLHDNIVVMEMVGGRDGDEGSFRDDVVLRPRGKPEVVVWLPKLDGFDFFFWQSASADARHNATASALFYSYMRISNMLTDIAVANPKDDVVEFTSTVDAVVLTINEVVFLKQKRDIDVPFNLLTKLQAALDNYDQSLEKLLTSGRLKRFLTSNRLRKEVEKWNTRLARALKSVDSAVKDLQSSAGVTFDYGMMTTRYSGRGSAGDAGAVRALKGANAGGGSGSGATRTVEAGKGVAPSDVRNRPVRPPARTAEQPASGGAPLSTQYEKLTRVPAKASGSYDHIPTFDGYGNVEESLLSDDVLDPYADVVFSASPGTGQIARRGSATKADGETNEVLGYIEDPEGSEMWRKGCGLRNALVEFDEFLAAFEAHTGRRYGNPDALRRILDPGRTNFVSQFKFSEFLKGFGPLSRVEDNVTRLLSQPWFHGFISARESELLLADAAQGVFLLRFSKSTTGSFALAFKSSSSVNHIMIQSALPEGFKIREGKATFKMFESLEAIIKNYDFVLKQPFQSHLTAQTWFQGDLTAAETEDLLQDTGVGTFLIRFSSFKAGALALSFAVAGNAVRHARIIPERPGGPYYVDGEVNAPRFTTVVQLVEHYREIGILRDAYE
jgi:hypothetical protein